MNLKKIVTAIAPFIGSLLGSPLAGIALAQLGSVFLNDDKASAKKIKAALARATPQDLIKLRQLENSLKSEMLAAGIHEQEIAALDRKNARKREMVLKDNMPAVLATLLTLGFFSILCAIIFYPVPETATDILNVMLGSLGTAFISVINYYFGSSRGSALKTQILGDVRG